MNETITITGNVATDPDHKRTQGGVPITTFRVASGQRRYDRQTGGWVDAATNWYTVSTFRSLADHAFESLKKGDRVLVTGRLKVREWEAGERRGTTVEIDAEAIGHDLLWGVSRFEKRLNSSAHSAALPDHQGSAESAPTTPADEWAAPGVDPETATEWPVAAVPVNDAEADALELVAADAPF
jgi:single-strand DNA-binding protein